jgi:hypothetical protein
MENDDMLRGIFGYEEEINRAIFGKSVPTITPAPIPVIPGHIPSARPRGSSPTSRKQEIRELMEQSLAQVGYNEEVMSGLVEAMASYLEQQIG